MSKSDKLIAALRAKYSTPQEAIKALGLDASILIPENKDMKHLSRTAVRFQSALAAHFAPKLAVDAKMPDFAKAVAGVTIKNYKAMLPKVSRLALDAALPAMAPGGGTTPDDVIIKLLDMVGGQAAAEPQAAELDQAVMPGAAPAPAAAAPVTDPSNGVVPGGEEEEEDEAPDAGKHDKLMGFLKDCGLDENALAQAAEMLKEHAAEEEEEPEHAEPKKPGEDGFEDDDTNKPGAGDDEGPNMKPQTVTKKAMDAALEEHGKKIMAQARSIQEARDFVQPWVGRTSMALDSVDAIYRHTCKAGGVDVAAVKDTAALRVIISQLPKPGAARHQAARSTELAMDADHEQTMAERFPFGANISIAS